MAQLDSSTVQSALKSALQPNENLLHIMVGTKSLNPAFFVLLFFGSITLSAVFLTLIGLRPGTLAKDI